MMDGIYRGSRSVRAVGVVRCVFRLPPRPRDEALPVLDRFAALMERSR